MSPDDVLQAAYDRRHFLALCGGAAGAALLAGCGGGGSGPGASGSGSGMAGAGKLEKELNVLNWGGYIDFAVKPFEQKYGVKVNMEHYGSETEAFAKVKASPGRYDTFNVGVGYLQPAVAQNLVQPIDVSRVASYRNSYPQFKPGPFQVNGKIYGVDYAWGTNGIAYNTKAVPSPVSSWAAFWDPAFKGKTALSDKAHDQYLAACLHLGYDFNQPTDAQWPQIRQAMIDRAKNMRTVWSSGDDLKRFMAQGDVILADCYDGLGVGMHAKTPSIVYAIPAEGTYGWYDGPELLANAPHPNAAYAWINFVTDTKMAMQVAKEVNYAPGDSTVPAKLPPSLRKQLNLTDPQSVISKLKFWQPLGPSWDKKIESAWAEAKAS
jgi:spermidine/putrescine transport system substrate-binding protein